MKKVILFEQYLNEITQRSVSGNSGRTYTTLDNSKYELKKDVKDAKIGDYVDVILPKGTIITNLPGGVFANHKDLKDKYCTGYKAAKWHDKFGVAIRTMPDTLEAIENNSKILESKYDGNIAGDSTREEIMDLMETKYKIRFVRTSEEFDGEKDGIWIAGDNGEELSGNKIFDYYNKSAKYKNGVLKNIVDVIEKKGWRFSWNDPGTMMIWPKN